MAREVDCIDCGSTIQHDHTRDEQRCDHCEELADDEAADATPYWEQPGWSPTR